MITGICGSRCSRSQQRARAFFVGALDRVGDPGHGTGPGAGLCYVGLRDGRIWPVLLSQQLI
jgi:hypothetical protein